MEIDHLLGTGGVVRFPVERRAKPTLLLAEELAPGSDLADAMADELAETRSLCRWAGGEGRPDTLAQVVEAFTTLAETLEFSMGVDAALAHLRAMNEVQDDQVWCTRSRWTACALAARAAADAARGAREALDCHERGEPWRRMTGEENGLFLIELKDMLDARRRKREDKPA